MQPQENDASDQRLAEIIPIARKIHGLIGSDSAEIPLLKSADPEETKRKLEWYHRFLQEKILPQIQGADIRVADIEFLTAVILQPVDFVRESLQEIVTDSVRELILDGIARKVIAFMGTEHDSIHMGNISKDEREELKNGIKKRLQDSLGAIVDGLIDIQAVMDLVSAPYKMTNEMLVATRTVVVDRAVAIKFGLKDAEDMRFSHIVSAQIEQASKPVDNAPIPSEAK